VPMKLSTKGRYAVRAMLDLALHYGEGPILLRDVARREHISERYLEQIILSLKAAGLVNSTRGARGGFMLTKPPSQIRLIEVMQVSEGSMAPVECVSDPKVCSRSSLCVTRDIWSEMKEAMSGILESTTLQDLVERQREKEQPKARMYYI
jgi:Rrf2 family cysteine metabolism transcriptional repressor